MTKRILIVFSICVASSLSAMAQINCSSSPNAKLVCLVPFISLNEDPKSTATSQALSKLSGLNGPIGAQLSQLPLAASAPGLITTTDASGHEHVYDNLGPILVDRPDSVGTHRLVFGANYQQFNFNALDGIDLHSVPFVYSTTAPKDPTNLTIPACQISACTTYIAQAVRIGIRYDQYVALLTYGFPNKLDVSLIVPVSRVSVGAGTLSGGQSVVVDETNTIVYQNQLGTFQKSGLASGVGDVSFNLKKVLWSGGETGRGSFATGATIRIPTGDALNYLGSGAYGFNLYALAAYKYDISPHAKIAYQWNSESVLLFDPTTKLEGKMPGGFQYALGFDAIYSKIPSLRPFTLSLDLIGNEYQNSPSYVKEKLIIPTASGPPPSSATTVTLDTVALASNTYSEADLSVGLKWRPFQSQDLVVYGNLLTQLNNVGLRSNLVPSGGISYGWDFRRRRK